MSIAAGVQATRGIETGNCKRHAVAGDSADGDDYVAVRRSLGYKCAHLCIPPNRGGCGSPIECYRVRYIAKIGAVNGDNKTNPICGRR